MIAGYMPYEDHSNGSRLFSIGKAVDLYCIVNSHVKLIALHVDGIFIKEKSCLKLKTLIESIEKIRSRRRLGSLEPETRFQSTIHKS